MRLLDDLAQKDTFIHRIHPLIKLITTIVYLTVVVSFERYEISGLLPFIFYPVLLFVLAEIPVVPILKMILLVEPLIIGIGILNPLFDHSKVVLVGIAFSRGWVTFLSIFIKCTLTVTASILLIATTGMDRLAATLRMLKIPKIFVLQPERVYQAMSLRGFTGEYYTGNISRPGFKDFSYFAVWSLFFVIARIYNIPVLIGSLFTGVIG